jgi:2-oxoglutarate/2-oxoacid ferredoxin oxidoreductase subunit alpha
VQEMMDFAMNAFDLADKYRIPVMVMAEGTLGQMMEPIIPRTKVNKFIDKPWATDGCKGRSPNIVNTLHLSPEFLEYRNQVLQEKYKLIKANEQKAETYLTEDADLVVVAFGLMSRIVKKAVMEARLQGHKVGLIRPITLWPFPVEHIRKAADTAKMFLSVEISMGQMVDDVRLAVNGKVPVEFYGRIGLIPSPEEIAKQIIQLAEREGL